MIKRVLVLMTCLGIFCCGFWQKGFGTTFTEEGVKARGVIFNVAEDRRIDYVNGYQEPESIDKYIKRKFDDVYAQLKTMNEKLDKISSQLEAKSKG